VRWLEIEDEKKNAKDEDQWRELNGAQDWQQVRFCEEKRVLSGMVLVALATSMESLLKRLRDYKDGTHPPKGPYTGDSALKRRCDEYQKRFGIALQDHKAFRTIEEVVLARNAFVHNEGEPDDRYQAFGPRYVSPLGKITVEPAQLASTIDDFKGLGVWLTEELRKLK
jgi:hypothetical protein